MRFHVSSLIEAVNYPKHVHQHTISYTFPERIISAFIDQSGSLAVYSKYVYSLESLFLEHSLY